MIISEVKEISVWVEGERLIEKAFIKAIPLAYDEFGIDEYGHSNKIKKWDRSDSSVRLELVKMEAVGSMMGWEYKVTFKAWCECLIIEE